MDRPRRPLHTTDYYIYPDDTGREYIKILGVIAVGLLLSAVLTFGRGWGMKYLWSDFIAVMLIASAAYKMFHLELFVKIHRSYDVVAHRWPAWSYAFPFIETAIGADFLLSNGSRQLYVLTLLVMGLTIYSRIQPVPSRVHLQFACLDSLIRLP